MDSKDDAVIENRRLRRTMRDLVALSALPAIWTGLGEEGIGRSLADALLSMLSLDLVYIRFAAQSDQQPLEFLRTKERTADPQISAKVRAAIVPLLHGDGAPASIPNPLGNGTLHLVVTRFGIGEGFGILIAGSGNPEFATEQDRLLLGVGANQTSIVLARLRSEAEVRAHRERLRVTLASIGDGVITTDALGNVTYLNLVAQKMTGWPLDEAVGRPLTEVFHIVNETSRKEVDNPALRALATGLVVGLANHTVLIGRDGGEHPIDDSAAPIRDLSGNVDGAVLVFRDITERKNAEDSLKARELRYRALVTATSDVVFLMSADWSQMQPMNGRDLVASNSGPIRDWLQKNIPPSEHKRVRDAVSHAIATEEIFELEHRVHRPDGSTGWTYSRAVPVRDAAGKVVEWFGTARDVTNQRQAAEELARVTAQSEQQKRLYETILSATPDFIYVFSLDYLVLYANDALIAMWGHPLKDTIGKTFLEIGYEPWHAEMHCREIDQVRATKRPIRGEVPFHGTLGRRIYDYIFVPVFGIDGEVEAVAGTTRDVTDRKKMEEELRQLAANLSDADRKKDEFLATLAHELRNPLAPIRNGLQLLKLTKNDPAATEMSRAMMERQVDQMVRLVDDLMDVSRISRGKIELRRERISLVEVLESAVETSRPLIEQMGHELTVSLPDQPIVVDADLTRLAQVFMNLLNNAAKYSDTGGHIWLSAERQADEVVVSVRDTGVGIAAEQLPRIFEMFSQVDRSLEKSQGGLGIGLTLVRRLVEMHDGSVEAHSAGLGKGSEFVVRLPVLLDSSVKKPAVKEEARSSGRRILIVDDNQDGAESLAIMLNLTGNETHTVHDGEAAITAATEFRPEVVLLDIGLPRLNGYEACRRMRELPGGKEMLIIAQTGWGQEADRQRTHAAGFDHHLVKPVDIVDLMNLLAGRKLPRSN